MVEEGGGSAPQSGVDLVLHRQGGKVAVQCKHWRSTQVGVALIREFLGVWSRRWPSAEPMLVTSSWVVRGTRSVRGHSMSRWGELALRTALMAGRGRPRTRSTYLEFGPGTSVASDDGNARDRPQPDGHGAPNQPLETQEPAVEIAAAVRRAALRAPPCMPALSPFAFWRQWWSGKHRKAPFLSRPRIVCDSAHGP